MERRLSVLVVCTANICRSPAAERLLAARLGPWIEVTSRGVRSVPGAAMCGASANWVLAGGGGPGDGHVSRPLGAPDIDAADLILTASSRHRAEVVSTRPSAQLRTFTLAQAARILSWRAAEGAVPPHGGVPDRMRWLVDELDAGRGLAPAAPDGTDDLPDPHSGASHEHVFARLTAAVDALCAPLLAGVGAVR
jgi:protein-tyrosine phosphatase